MSHRENPDPAGETHSELHNEAHNEAHSEDRDAVRDAAARSAALSPVGAQGGGWSKKAMIWTGAVVIVGLYLLRPVDRLPSETGPIGGSSVAPISGEHLERAAEKGEKRVEPPARHEPASSSNGTTSVGGSGGRSTRLNNPRPQPLGSKETPRRERGNMVLSVPPPRPQVPPETGRERVARDSAGAGLLVKGGTVLHARMTRAVSSDSPSGLVEARLVEPVLERGTGLTIFPEQTQLFGRITDLPELGRIRIGIVWIEAVLPAAWGGWVVPLGLPAADTRGVGGIETDVSFRWGSLYGHAALSSVIGALAQGAQSPEGGNARFEGYTIAGFAERAESVTEETTRRLADRRPRFRLAQGEQIGVDVRHSFRVRFDS